MIKNIGIIDYGCGNIHSLSCALKKIGCSVSIVSNDKENKNLNGIFIPGVGSFDNAMNKIKKKNLDKVIYEYFKNDNLIVGICLGMQILVDTGIENSITEGLKLIRGETYKLKFKKNEKNINIGWNETYFNNKKFNQFDKEKFYYVHSYAVETHQDLSCCYSTFNENKFISGLINQNIYAFQFHPEKSRNVGLDLLKEVIKN